MKVEQFRADLRAWLDEHDLTPGPDHSLQGHIEQIRPGPPRALRRRLDAVRLAGEVGGLGGPAMLRAVVGEEVVGRRLAEPGPYSMVEVLAPTMIYYAPPSSPRRWCRACSAGASNGARAFPSPVRAATWRRCPPAPPATATTGSSTGRRSGPATRSSPPGASCSPAPRRATTASPRSSSTWTPRASPFGRCARCTESTNSARSISTTW